MKEIGTNKNPGDQVGMRRYKPDCPGSHTRRNAPTRRLGAEARQEDLRRTGGRPRIRHALNREAQGYMAAWKYDSPCSMLALSSCEAHDGRMSMPSVCQHCHMNYTLVGPENTGAITRALAGFLFSGLRPCYGMCPTPPHPLKDDKLCHRLELLGAKTLCSHQS